MWDVKFSSLTSVSNTFMYICYLVNTDKLLDKLSATEYNYN